MLITLEQGDFGTYLLIADNGQTRLIQTDWDYPGVAACFGFVPCECGFTDGTVDCAHKTAGQMIQAAAAYMDEHCGDSVDDPGYFEEVKL